MLGLTRSCSNQNDKKNFTKKWTIMNKLPRVAPAKGKTMKYTYHGRLVHGNK